jgi:hypothetical protein
VVDIAIATVLLIPASLVIAIFAILIKLEDRGPAIFRQRRVGRDAETFEVLKLRTMVVDAEARRSSTNMSNSPRSCSHAPSSGPASRGCGGSKPAIIRASTSTNVSTFTM